MAGFLKIYVIGGPGGFMGTDGVNSIDLMILVGEGHRQWLEPHYFSKKILPVGKLQTIIPSAPDHQDALLDACIAFCPIFFKSCPSLAEVESALHEETCLDFDLNPDKIPTAWATLREEARPIFAGMNIWQANLIPLDQS